MTLLVIPVGRNTPLFSTARLFVTKNDAMCCSHDGKWGQSCICDIILQRTSGNCTPGSTTGRAHSLTSWLLQQTLIASTSSFLQLASLPGCL